MAPTGFNTRSPLKEKRKQRGLRGTRPEGPTNGPSKPRLGTKGQCAMLIAFLRYWMRWHPNASGHFSYQLTSSTIWTNGYGHGPSPLEPGQCFTWGSYERKIIWTLFIMRMQGPICIMYWIGFRCLDNLKTFQTSSIPHGHEPIMQLLRRRPSHTGRCVEFYDIYMTQGAQ